MWRTAFLTLRDETVISPNPKFVAGLLDNLVFSQSDSLVAAASDLLPSEVTSDMMFLVGLLGTSSHGGDDMVNAFVHICQLIYRISCYVSLEINSSSWAFMLDSFGSLVDVFLGKDENKMAFIESSARIEAIMESLHSIRHLMIVLDKRDALSENIELVKFLLRIIAYSHAKLQHTLDSNGNHPYVPEVGSVASYNNSFWEVQHVALTMTREAFSRIGPTFPADLWQLTLKVVFRKVMDVFASKNMVREENILARFYTSLLDCLHLVLVDPKASISEHGPVACPNDAQNLIESSSGSVVFTSVEPKSSSCGPYRPPHLRRNGRTLQPVKAQGSQQFSYHEFSSVDLVSSDSDYSDSDGSTKELDNVRSSKVRIAAILCIQDLCHADPKSFIAQWTMILPTVDVLCPRKYEATLLTCLLFDPHAKVRLASVAALIAMLDGSSSIIQQIAEYKESNKCGSFTALSTSVGQILMQLYTGCCNQLFDSGIFCVTLFYPGFVTAQRTSSILLMLFQMSSQVVTLSISLEALQALRAVSHNYPNIMALCWKQVSNLVYGLLTLTCSEAQMRLGDGQAGNSGGLMVEKVVAASIKVLDGCLRGISGFKGTEDLLDEKLFDTPFTSDCLRMKKISSAPSYGLRCPGFSRNGLEEHISGNEQWCEAIEKHMSLTFCHSSSMVRAASATCYAGLTSSVFASLPKGKQEFILTSSIEAAVNDEAPSVRSAACRAIGVIACFPQISYSTEILHKLCLAIETSTRDPVVSVRIPASWALANISDSFRHCNADFSLNGCCIESRANSQLMTLLIQCALLLSKDGDKAHLDCGPCARTVGYFGSIEIDMREISHIIAYYFVFPVYRSKYPRNKCICFEKEHELKKKIEYIVERKGKKVTEERISGRRR
ncbi:protein of unknown function DUF4042 [Dillenia turbinata]|uniref:DUF4042 domain-containing protein n=1 Tax=Dillenia turbinata TaxID=194707 RepID=A0AAN8VY93_9MAGN